MQALQGKVPFNLVGTDGSGNICEVVASKSVDIHGFQLMAHGMQLGF